MLYNPNFSSHTRDFILEHAHSPHVLSAGTGSRFRSASHYPNNRFPTMLEPTKKPLSFLAAPFCKLWILLLVSRLLTEGSHLNRILFITWCKPDPITGAEALGG
jgi:hypothetical protein